MYRSQTKTWWAIALAVGLVGGVVACSDTTEPATTEPTPEEPATPRPQFAAPLSNMIRIGSSCFGSIPPRSSGGTIIPDCADLWLAGSTNTIAVGVPTVMICDPNGVLTYDHSQRYAQHLPVSSDFVANPTADSPYLSVHSGDPNNQGYDWLKMTVTGLRPTNNANLHCLVETFSHSGYGAYTDGVVKVSGPAPYLQSMFIKQGTIGGGITVDWPATPQLTAHYHDQYGFNDLLGSLPTTWTSNNTSVATVSSTGLVTTLGNGVAPIKACAMNGTTQVCSPYFNVTVMGTSVTNSQSGDPQLVDINTTGSTTFTVTNNASSGRTLALTCTAVGSISCGTVSPSSLTLAGNASTTVTVGYSASGVWGTGGLTLTAEGGGVASVSYKVEGGPLTAAINYGPGSVKPRVQCEWMANGSGGYTPYTWQWTVDGNPVSGSGNDIYYTNSNGDGTSFQLGITITDGHSNSITAYKTVSVSSSAPTCAL